MESAGPMTRSKAKSLAATPLIETTNAAPKTTGRKTGRGKAADEVAPGPDSPVRRTALLDDFNKVEQVAVAAPEPATATPVAAAKPEPGASTPEQTVQLAPCLVDCAIRAEAAERQQLATPASAMSFGNGAAAEQAATPDLFTGVKLNTCADPTPRIEDLLRTPVADDLSVAVDVFGTIPGLTPVAMGAGLATPASAMTIDKPAEVQAPDTEPVQGAADNVQSFFASPAPVSANSEQAWVPAEQVAFQPTPQALSCDTAAPSPYVTLRSKATEQQAAEETAALQDQPQQDQGSAEQYQDMAVDQEAIEEPAATPTTALTAAKNTAKATKTVAFTTPAISSAMPQGRTPLMSQLSGAGHTPWARSHQTPALASTKRSAPPVPKFTPAAQETPTAQHSATTKPSATSAQPTSWSFLKPTASSQAKATAAGAAMPAAAAPAAEKPRLKSVVVVPEHSTADPRSLTSLRKEVKKKLEAKATKEQSIKEAEEAQKAQQEEVQKSAVVLAEALRHKAIRSAEEEAEEDGEYYEEEGEEDDDAIYDQDAEAELVQGMQGLGLHKLRGLPTPAGKHIRFDEEGEVVEAGEQGASQQEQAAPVGGQLKLRGLPTPAGKHIKFDD